MISVGLYFYTKNKNAEDYYVGGRDMNSWHIGLSVVATDVGGGFSIGLDLWIFWRTIIDVLKGDKKAY